MTTDVHGDEAGFLAAYDPAAYPAFAVTVDLAALTIRDGALSLLLVRRAEPPFAGRWALPGSFIGPAEDADAAAARTLRAETGLDARAFTGHLEQLRTYTAPGRDPRMRVVSVAHLAFAPHMPAPRADAEAAWWPVERLPLGRRPRRPGADGGRAGAAGAPDPRADDTGADGGTVDVRPSSLDVPQLAFDHEQIITDALDRVAAKLEYTTLATRFVDETFTIGELQAVYEAVWGVPLDRANFRRKVLAADGMVVAVDEAPRLTAGRGRPAALHRAGPARELHPPMLRPAVTPDRAP